MLRALSNYTLHLHCQTDWVVSDQVVYIGEASYLKSYQVEIIPILLSSTITIFHFHHVVQIVLHQNDMLCQ